MDDDGHSIVERRESQGLGLSLSSSSSRRAGGQRARGAGRASADDAGHGPVPRRGLEGAEGEAVGRHLGERPHGEDGLCEVRALARRLGLDDLAELPAAPCLSSRVETGVAIDAAALGAINDVELALTREHAPRTVRCRLRGAAIVIELDADTLARLDADERARVRGATQRRFREAGVERPVGFSTYSRGSAFVHETGRG